MNSTLWSIGRRASAIFAATLLSLSLILVTGPRVTAQAPGGAGAANAKGQAKASAPPAAPPTLQDALKGVVEAEKAVATALGSVGDTLKKVQDAVAAADPAAQAKQAAAAKSAVGDTLKEAVDQLKAVGDAQTKASAALDVVVKAAAPPPDKFALAPSLEGWLPTGFQRFQANRIGFFAVRFEGAFTMDAIVKATSEGRRLVRQGWTLGRRGVVTPVSMKDGDKAYPSIAFGFFSDIDRSVHYIAMGIVDQGVNYHDDANRSLSDVLKGEVRENLVAIAGLGTVILRAGLRDGQADLYYDFVPAAPAALLDQIRLVGQYEAAAGSGDSAFQFFAVLIQGSSNPLANALPITFGQEAVRRRGTTLAQKRNEVTLLPGDRLILASQNAGLTPSLIWCVLFYDAAGRLVVTFPPIGPAIIPIVDDFIELSYPGPAPVRIPIQIEERPNRRVGFTFQVPQ